MRFIPLVKSLHAQLDELKAIYRESLSHNEYYALCNHVNELMDQYFEPPYKAIERSGIHINFFQAVLYDRQSDHYVHLNIYETQHLRDNVNRSLDYLLHLRKSEKPSPDRLELLTELRKIEMDLLVALRYNHTNTLIAHESEDRALAALTRLIKEIEKEKTHDL